MQEVQSTRHNTSPARRTVAENRVTKRVFKAGRTR
jgi:hypothetical protein